MRAVGDNLPDSFVYRYRRDPSGNPQYLYISAGVERLTGVTVEQALADPRALYALVLPECLSKLLEAEQAAKRDLTDFAVEIPIRRKDGEVRWMRQRARPETQPDGRLLWNGVQTDITESVADQERLRESEAALRAMGDNLPDSVVFQYTRDPEGNARFLYISAGVERLTGVAVEEALADAGALYAQVLPEYLPKLLEAERAAARDLTDFAVEVPIRRKDGEVRWMRLRARPARRSNREILWNGVWTDITESVIDQERLRQSEARLRAVGDNLPNNSIFQYVPDQDGTPRFLYLSAGIEKITGIAVEEALANGDALFSQILPEYRSTLSEARQAATRDLTDFAVEVPFRRADGEVRWMRLHSRPDPQPDGRILWNGVQTDITEEKRLQTAQLEAAQRQSFQLELSDAIKPLRDPFEIIAVVSERLGKQLGCHQVVYAEIDAKQE